jgi:hypothetical protein
MKRLVKVVDDGRNHEAMAGLLDIYDASIWPE